MDKKYNDILHLEHHVSKNHPQMSMQMRAAQFAPFAALAGHDQAIERTARDAEERMNSRETAEFDDC